MAQGLKPDLCNLLNIWGLPLALRNTTSLLVIFSPENTLAGFPVGSIFLSPKANVCWQSQGSVSDTSPRLSDQRAHAGQIAPENLLLKLQESWAVPHTDPNTTAVPLPQDPCTKPGCTAGGCEREGIWGCAALELGALKKGKTYKPRIFFPILLHSQVTSCSGQATVSRTSHISKLNNDLIKLLPK